MAKTPENDKARKTDDAVVTGTDETSGVEDANVDDDAPDVTETIEDAEILDDAADGQSADTETETESDDAQELAEPDGDLSREDELRSDGGVSDTEDTDPDPEPKVVSERVVERGPGFLPLVLGGLVAAGLGYGAAYVQNQEESTAVEASLSAQSNRIAELEEFAAAAPPAPDLSGIESRIAELGETVDGQINAMTVTLADLSERLVTLERQPNEDGTLADAALSAYEREIEELRAQIADQQGALRAMVDQATNDLEQTRAEAQAIEDTAVANARRASARAALAKIQVAAESGAPFNAALEELGASFDGELPADLSAAADGLPTIGALQDSFPAAARNALSQARTDGVDGEDAGGLTGFLRTQFAARSVAPKEGDSVDAILSRSEAAIKEGRLNDALAEVATLPEPVRATLSDWLGQAETRAAALDALARLSSDIENK